MTIFEELAKMAERGVRLTGASRFVPDHAFRAWFTSILC